MNKPEAYLDLYNREKDFSVLSNGIPVIIGNISLGICEKVAYLCEDLSVKDSKMSFDKIPPPVVLNYSAYNKIIYAKMNGLKNINIELLILTPYGDSKIVSVNIDKLYLVN
ncbi:MAG: hypothetical protein PHZ26_02845 [Candidatus Gracilibacteria bacterium]|nr:hypothetical protein [Candidatus Gracilibacteria bacterium]MDD2908670.1 hypothetical protein [Candidatus Gracilibacteria bacterium]